MDERSPDAIYLATIAARGVDTTYLLTGERIWRPTAHERLAEITKSRGKRAITDARPEALPGGNSPQGDDTLSSDEDLFVPVPLHDAALAAGGGAVNETEAVIGTLPFPRVFLRRLGIRPAAARLAWADGPSMERTIFHRDTLLLDTDATALPTVARQPGDNRPRPIYSFLDDGEARLKRIDRLDAEHLVLISDNPDFAPEIRPVTAIQPIGRVWWWAHTVRE